ncbi:MAG: hypothetical protein AABN95_03375 [Acidobacteriota bacterium]
MSVRSIAKLKLNSYDAVPHVYRSYWLSGHGKPDPAQRKADRVQGADRQRDGDLPVQMSMRSTLRVVAAPADTSARLKR